MDKSLKAKLKKYGLTENEYKKMIAKTDNKCYICGNPPKTRSLNIDHDHRKEKQLRKEGKNISGSVRGLLCFWCNSHLISKTGDKDNAVELFLKAAEYIRKFRE
jgi:hypothetical protein